MKKILCLLVLAAAFSASAQSAYDWDNIDTLLAHGRYASADTIVQWYQAAAQRAGNGVEQLNAAFYRTTINYARHTKPSGRAIKRFSDLARSLRGPEGAIASVMLIQSYHGLAEDVGIGKMYYRSKTDDPGLSPYEWDLGRLLDSVAWICSHRLGALDSLDRLPAIPRFISADNAIDLETALTASLLDLHNDTRIYGRFPGNDSAFCQAVLSPLAVECLRTPSEKEHYLAQFFHQAALRHAGDTPANQLRLDLVRLDFFFLKVWKHARWISALDSFIRHYEALSVDDADMAQLYYLKASVLKEEGRHIEARDLCLRVEQRCPATLTALNCYNLRQTIEAPHHKMDVEQVVHSQRNRLALVTYRNIDRLNLRLVAIDTARSVPSIDSALRLPVCKEWTQPLPPYSDYEDHRAYIPIPMLPQGGYLLLTSDGADPARWSNANIGITRIESADALFMVFNQTFANYCTNYTAGWLVDRATGRPIAKERVDFAWREEGRRRSRSCRTDRQGYFDLRGHRIHSDPVNSDIEGLSTQYGGYRYLYKPYFYYLTHNMPEADKRAGTMLDKPIYRLGEEVQFSSVVYSQKTSARDFLQEQRLLKNQPVTAYLIGTDHDTISRLQLVTDEWGQCSGAFLIPDYLRNGRYEIRLYSGTEYLDYKSFEVDAYKLPRFSVRLSTDGSKMRLGSPITIKGIAAAHNGSSMAGCMAEYVIYGDPWEGFGHQEIEGEAAVANDGTFEITFVPDPVVDEEDDEDDDNDDDNYRKYIYWYDVRVSVHSPDGEEQIGEASFLVGKVDADLDILYTAGNRFEVLCNDLSGNPLEDAVRISAQRLLPPALSPLATAQPYQAAPFMNSHGYFSDLWAGTEEQFRQLFPRYAFHREEWDVSAWTPGTTVFDTLLEGRTLDLPADFASGCYRFTLSLGDTISRAVDITYLSPFDNLSAGTDLLSLRQTRFFPKGPAAGDTISLDITSAFPNQTVYYRVVSGPNTLRSGTLLLNDPADSQSSHLLSIPVPRTVSGYIECYFVAVREGEVCRRSTSFRVQHPEYNLEVTAESFRDKLRPGESEQWTFRIGGVDKNRASLTLSLYDAALDQVYNTGFRPVISKFYHDPGRFNIVLSADRQVSFAPTKSCRPVPYPVLLAPAAAKGTMLRTDKFYQELLSSSVLRAGSNFIKGIVSDKETGGTIPFAQVAVMQGEKLVKGVWTDFDGLFIISGIGNGPYDLHISTVGYNKHIYTNIQINTARDYELKPSDQALSEVVICEAKVPVIEIGAAESGSRVVAEDISYVPASEDVNMGFFSMGVSSDGEPEVPVPMRENLATTAFFLPALHTDASGLVTASFTVPDVLTRWSLRGMAWSPTLQTGYFTGSALTQKELMVLPQVPRFLRQCDTAELRAKVANTTDSAQQVRVRLEMGASATDAFFRGDTALVIPARSSRIAAFRFAVPDTLHTAQYRITARSHRFSDGEQAEVPVLSRRVQVAENRLLYLFSSDSQRVERSYPLLFNHQPAEGGADTLSLAFCSDPARIALQSVPQFERLRNPSNIYNANRLYAACVQYLADVRTPDRRLRAMAEQLRRDQKNDGSWSWMPQGNSSPYATRCILDRAAEAERLFPGIIPASILLNGAKYIDQQLVQFDSIMQQEKFFEETEPSCLISNWIYLRSRLGSQVPMDSVAREAFARCYRHNAKHRDKIENLHSRAQLALTAQHIGDTLLARDEAQRLKELALCDPDQGLYWRDNLGGLYWWERPIETQALMVDVFADILGDWPYVARLQQWILTQRQASSTWGTDMATCAAVQALLRSETSYVTSFHDSSALRPQKQAFGRSVSNCYKGEAANSPISVSVAEQALVPDSVGDYAAKWSNADVAQLMHSNARLTLSRTVPGTSWGAITYQYEEALENIPHNETGIQIQKKFYRIVSDDSLVLITDTTRLRLGDRLRVIIRLECDRTFDHLTLTDQRAGSFEPLDTESGWRYNNGQRYYADIRNDETRFYIERLIPGIYTAQYDIYLLATGTYAAGIATIQSTYAPEFRSNTQSRTLQIK